MVEKTGFKEGGNYSTVGYILRGKGCLKKNEYRNQDPFSFQFLHFVFKLLKMD
jgi:hypothetical protein